MLNPDLYEKVNSPVHGCAKKILSEYGHLLKWPSNSLNPQEEYYMNILDAGCGDGSSTINIFQDLVSKNIRKYKITGVDLEDMVLKAKKNYNDEPNCEFKQMDLSLKEFPVEFVQKFDLIYSALCLHWIKTTHWVNSFYKMLKQTGQTFLLAIKQNCLVDAVEIVQQREKWSKYRNDFFHSPFLTNVNQEEWLIPLFEEVGFKNITLIHDVYDANFPNKTFLISLIKCFKGIYSSVPTTLTDAFVNEVVEEIIFQSINNYGSNPSGIIIKAPVVLIIAEK